MEGLPGAALDEAAEGRHSGHAPVRFSDLSGRSLYISGVG